MKTIVLSIALLLCSFLAATEKNSVIVCENGLEMFDYVLDSIEAAEQSIEISGPLMGGKIFRQLIDKIDHRMEKIKDLQCYLLASELLFEERDSALLKSFQEKYRDRVHVVMSRHISEMFPEVIAYHNHVKLIVVDETYFALGGTNLDEGCCTEGTYTPPQKPKSHLGMLELPWGARDGDVVGRGPIAKELRQTFYKLYAVWEHVDETYEYIKDPDYFAQKNHYRALKAGNRAYVDKIELSPELIDVDDIKMVFSGPQHKPNKITQSYVELIGKAEDEIYLGNLYFFPTQGTLDALMAAVNRGCDLTLITNGIYEGVTPAENGKWCWANRSNYVPMFYGREFGLLDSLAASCSPLRNTTIYEYYVKNVVFHKKVMVVDRRYLVIGSYNLGLKSEIGDYEIVLVIDAPKAAEREIEIMKRDITFSKEVTPRAAAEWYFDPAIVYISKTQKTCQGAYS